LKRPLAGMVDRRVCVCVCVLLSTQRGYIHGCVHSSLPDTAGQCLSRPAVCVCVSACGALHCHLPPLVSCAAVSHVFMLWLFLPCLSACLPVRMCMCVGHFKRVCGAHGCACDVCVSVCLSVRVPIYVTPPASPAQPSQQHSPRHPYCLSACQPASQP